MKLIPFTTKKTNILLVTCILLFVSLVSIKKRIEEKIIVKFYYNEPGMYYDCGRNEKSIMNGYAKSVFILERDEISSYLDIKNVLNEKPKIIDNLEMENLYKNYVDCLCIIYKGNDELLRFTYSESDNEFQLWNGRLVRRSEALTDFAKKIIEKNNKN